MADNLTTTTTVSTVPSGTVISTDDAGASGHVQRVKLALSADGSAAHAQVDADGVLVNLGANNDVTLATLPDTAAGDLAAINAAVSGTVTVDGSGVTQPVSGTVTETNSAAILADTASMDTNLGTVAGAVAGTEMQVDVVASLPAGDNNIGNVDIASSVALDVSAATVTVDLGTNNDVTTELTTDDLDTGAGTDTRAVVGMVLAESGGGVLVGSANPMPVDGSGVTQPISASSLPLPTGAATAANQSTIAGHVDGIEALLGTIDADTSALAGAVAGTEIQADIVASLPAGDNNIGNVDIASSVALDVSAATVTVDLGANNDVVASGDVAHDTADSGSPVKVGGKAVNFDGTAPGTAVAENDRANFVTDVYGRQFVEMTHPNYWHVSADYAAAQTNTTVKAAPGAGLKLYITDIVISNGATAGNITLLNGSGGAVLIELYPAINGGMSTNLRTPIALSANTLLAVTSTTVTTHSVFVSGYTAP